MPSISEHMEELEPYLDELPDGVRELTRFQLEGFFENLENKNQAQGIIDREGVLTETASGRTIVHPAMEARAKAERSMASAYAKIVKALGESGSKVTDHLSEFIRR